MFNNINLSFHVPNPIFAQMLSGIFLMKKQNQTQNSTVKNKAYEVDTNIFFCCMYNIWNICAYLEVETKKQDAKMLYYLFYLDKYR